jgi:Transposase DDE domain
VVVEGCLAPANAADLAVGEELLAGVAGWVLADRNYGSPRLAEQLADQGAWLLAPPKGTKRSRQRPPPWLVGKRRRIETVLGQLTGRYQLRRVWARDAWHLWSRWLRKLLSHTMAVLLCQQAGLPPLRFAQLITA